jgi:hypothetical protein
MNAKPVLAPVPRYSGDGAVFVGAERSRVIFIYSRAAPNYIPTSLSTSTRPNE